MHRGTADGVSPSAIVLSSAIPPRPRARSRARSRARARARARISPLGTHQPTGDTPPRKLCCLAFHVSSDSVNPAAFFVLMHS